MVTLTAQPAAFPAVVMMSLPIGSAIEGGITRSTAFLFADDGQLQLGSLRRVACPSIVGYSRERSAGFPFEV